MQVRKSRWLIWIAAVMLAASSVASSASSAVRSAGLTVRDYSTQPETAPDDEASLVEKVNALFAPGDLPGAADADLPRCATPLLVEIDARWHSLAPQTRDALSQYPVALGARGLSMEDLGPFDGSPGLRLDTAHFSIYYVLIGDDAAPSADTDADGVPDYVEAAATALEVSYQAEVHRLGWTAPPVEGSLYNVYLMRAGAQGFVSPNGTTHWESYAGDNPNSPEVQELYSVYSHIVLNTSLTPDQMRATAAHEFCHAIQLGTNGDVDGWESRLWLMEATSSWMESQVFDIHDNVYFVQALFESPDESMFDQHLWYADWLFLQYISEHYGGPETVRDIWARGARMSGHWSFPALIATLSARGHSVDQVFLDYSVANLVLASCDHVVSRYCYRDAGRYREMIGVPRIEGRVTVSPPSGMYLPPDGVGPFGADYVQVSPEAAWIETGVYGQDPESAYMGCLVAVHENGVAVWPLSVGRGTGAPEVAISTQGYTAIYLVIANTTVAEQADWARYGVAFVAAASAPPTPTRVPVDKGVYIPSVCR